MSKEESAVLKKWKKYLIMAGLITAGIIILAVLLWKVLKTENDPAKKVVFRIGNEAVYLDEVNFCILQNVINSGITADMLDKTEQNGNSADDSYKNAILQMIVDYKVEAMVAKQRGITLSDEETEAVRNDTIEYMQTVNGHTLKQLGITQDRIAEIYTDRYLACALEETVTKDIAVEDQNYCTIYILLFPKLQMDENGDYLTQENGETPIMLSEEEIKQKKADADAAYQELLDGADIEETAKKYGVEAVSEEESNLADSFGEPFCEYTKTLKENEYSPVLETESCYAIIKMLQFNNEELANQILQYYRLDLEEEAINENKSKWYEEAGADGEVEFAGRTWDSISLYDFVQYVEE